jgi:hypothetical protein
MKTIICLGPKACSIGELYEVSAEPLTIKLIDKEVEGENCFSIPSQKTPEDYEKNTPDLTTFFSDITDEILFIVSGECEVANCSLKILHQIKDKKITIVYLVPSLDFLSTKQALQERVIRNILQEYTRSGLFQKIILLDNAAVESTLNSVSINNYESSFNGVIYSALQNHKAILIIDPILDYANKPKDISRIVTFGYYYVDTDQEVLLYNMNMVDDKIYHFYLSEETLNKDLKLLKTIKEKLKNKANENTKISYTIRMSSTESNFCFVEAYTKLIQQ